MNLEPDVPRPELDALIEAAREAVKKMTPEERSSMYASQAIGYVMSELVMSVHEDNVPAATVREQLDRMLGALDGDAGVYIHMPQLVERIWSLLPRAKEDMRNRIRQALSELDT